MCGGMKMKSRKLKRSRSPRKNAQQHQIFIQTFSLEHYLSFMEHFIFKQGIPSLFHHMFFLSAIEFIQKSVNSAFSSRFLLAIFRALSSLLRSCFHVSVFFPRKEFN